MQTLFAQTPLPSSDINGYLLLGIAALFAAGIGSVAWFAKVYLPKQDDREEARQLLHANRSDVKDVAHLAALNFLTDAHLLTINEQRKECRNEREVQYKMFDETLKRNEHHMGQLFEMQKEDMAALKGTLDVLSQAVHQLYDRGGAKQSDGDSAKAAK